MKTCKGFLNSFMTCCSLKHLRGRVNTFTMANNSADSLVLDEAITICAAFQSITLVLPWSGSSCCQLCRLARCIRSSSRLRTTASLLTVHELSKL